MSMISELVDRLRVESKSMGKYGVDYMSTLLMDASDTIVMLSEKARAARPNGKWVGGQEFCKHLEEKTGERYAPTGLGKLIYCNQCWQANDRHSAYCPDCGSRMKGEDDD